MNQTIRYIFNNGDTSRVETDTRTKGGRDSNPLPTSEITIEKRPSTGGGWVVNDAPPRHRDDPSIVDDRLLAWRRWRMAGSKLASESGPRRIYKPVLWSCWVGTCFRRRDAKFVQISPLERAWDFLARLRLPVGVVWFDVRGIYVFLMVFVGYFGWPCMNEWRSHKSSNDVNLARKLVEN